MTPKEYALSIFNLLPPGVDALAFIGGGCFRSLFDGTEVKDIDLFFASYTDYLLALQFFSWEPRFSELKSDVSGARIFSDGVNPPFNLVGFRFHKTLGDLVADFDLTCVTCGAEMVEPGVVEVIEGPDFVCDASHKYLRFNKVQNHDRAVKRIARYESYGYTRTRSVAAQLVRSRFIPAPKHGGDY
jgi:hypothetical protein